MNKFIRFVRKKIIFLGEPFNCSKYMKKYTKFLKKNGMNIKGIPRYIAPSVYFDGSDYTLISIGDRSVISKEVILLTHDYSIARGLESIGKHNSNMYKDELYLKPISIGKNCFIGLRTIILPGAEISDNCIIGAGSVVSGKIPANTIAFGNPLKIYCKTDEWALNKIKEGGYFVEK